MFRRITSLAVLFALTYTFTPAHAGLGSADDSWREALQNLREATRDTIGRVEDASRLDGLGEAGGLIDRVHLVSGIDVVDTVCDLAEIRPPKTVGRSLRPLLNSFGNDPRLTLIVFTLDESTYGRELAPLAGHYPALRLGPPWWFFDSLNGMERARELMIETAGLHNTVGFNDDTRAFPSIPARHDAVPQLQPAGFLERHRKHASVAEPDGLGAQPLAAGRLDLAEVPQRHRRTRRFDQQTHHVEDRAGPAERFRAADVGEMRGQVEWFHVRP